jgi:hypothetical protein
MAYPVRLEVDRQDEYSRLLPLVKWLLLVPHYIVLLFLAIGAAFALVAAAFVVLFTGRYPRGIFNYVTGVYRWGLRVAAYLLLLTDSYPPFSLQHDPGLPVRFEVDYPEQGVARWRPFFAWLVAIPYLWAASIAGNLGGLMSFFALFTILFKKRFPEGMFDIALVGLRWHARGNSYAYAWVTRYPPFRWE